MSIFDKAHEWFEHNLPYEEPVPAATAFINSDYYEKWAANEPGSLLDYVEWFARDTYGWTDPREA